jgi:hypothetical protein
MRAPLLVAWTLGGCLLGAVGCDKLLSIQDPVAGHGPGQDGGIDGGGLLDGSPILLSEVVVTPTEAEMIEIVNTSNQDVDLTNYYLSDSGNYFRLPVGPTVDTNDFIAKFPDNTVLAGHGVITVAIDTPELFASKYQQSPTFSLADGTMKVVVANAPTLTNTGEPIILFRWDGKSDLVTDIDIMIVGMPSGANPLTVKSGMSQDGSDADNRPSTYASDANTIKPQASAPASTATQMISTQRILLEAGHENQGGNGNGQAGDDETSEDTSVTWDGTAAHPFGMATPGRVPPQMLR